MSMEPEVSAPDIARHMLRYEQVRRCSLGGSCGDLAKRLNLVVRVERMEALLACDKRIVADWK